MEKVVIGYRYVSYVNKDGKFVDGYELFCVSPVGDNNGNPAKGFRWFTQKDKPTKPLWISVQRFNNLTDKSDGELCNKIINIFYNEFGSLADIQVVEK